MAQKEPARLRLKLNFTDQGEAPPLQAYAFTSGGKIIGSAKVENGAAAIDMPPDFDGRTLEVILGPRMEAGQPPPTAASLKRMGAIAKSTRFLAKEPLLELNYPSIIFPHWCLCFVRGRLVKRFTLPNGTTVERPVCSARVNICEVDRIPLVIERIPAPDIFRLRDELLEKLKVIPRPFPPRPWPEPGPRPWPFNRMMAAQDIGGAQTAGGGEIMQQSMTSLVSLAGLNSVDQIRKQLIDLSAIISIYLCDLTYFWSYFRVDCLTTVEADSEGRFSTLIAYDCNDKPDLYFWVEQFQEGVWQTVYRPSTACGTYWNYSCGTEITINLPRSTACEEPTYDIPPGVTLFVLPNSIANAYIWGIPPGAPPAPDGWVRPDGFIDYYSGPGLDWLYNAPFGGTLNFIQDDSYFIPSSGIKYYRYSYRRLNSSPNTGADDASWTPITTPLNRGYRIEYSDRLPTYESYPVGPFTVGGHSGLFEFKPQVPPARPTDPATVVVREWTSGNLSEVAASWTTEAAAPPLSGDNTVDDAGDFEVKIEVFNPAGAQVIPGAPTFVFLARNPDLTTTRLATAAEQAGGAYILRVHVDNNRVEADLPQPSIGGMAASDDCGFLRYETGDLVHVSYLASHPNDHAVFGFGITRGSNGLPSATTTAPYVEAAAASAPTGTTPYIKSGDYYQRNFTPAELVGTCVNAAFAASLGVYGKATNGYQRLGIDASRLIAFALAEETEEDA